MNDSDLKFIEPWVESVYLNDVVCWGDNIAELDLCLNTVWQLACCLQLVNNEGKFREPEFSSVDNQSYRNFPGLWTGFVYYDYC